MIELVTLPPAFGLRNVSPFCFKAELLITSLGLDFTTSDIQDPRKAPKGKLPYLQIDGRQLADSELITLYLDEISGGAVFSGLSPEQKAQGMALTRLVEDHLYWIVVASRWLDEGWFPNVSRDFFGFVPALIRPLVTRAARRQVKQTYNLHGLGRHTLEEQKNFARRDLETLDAAVGESGFLFGENPGVFDFTVTGLMATVYGQQPETWFNALTVDYKRLRRHTEEVQQAVGIYARYT
jgi:glutathione S-transferase